MPDRKQKQFNKKASLLIIEQLKKAVDHCRVIIQLTPDFCSESLNTKITDEL